MFRNMQCLFVIILLCSAVAGCGNNRRSAPVSGKVTSGGQPVADVIVRFQPVGKGDTDNPEAGMGSFGKTDSDGNFTMLFSDDESSGAMIGEHTVIIDELTPPEEENNDAGGLDQVPKSRIPQKWSDGSARFTVKEGNNEANFDLSQ